ncbi:hypothetical protein SLEP1_g32537 [Rubroshorea leprosula]|uniref:Uncharacterized protein n=1 Tax=Rubroshorea leprosula TaxID=152421 RepID=A0AAV5KDL5_9ROSI|nr:hypothetical protein SLEP1_g32537 [Rubroshorea leprosula]
MNALDNTGKAWSFPCSVHHDETTGTVVSVFWDEFVREKGVGQMKGGSQGKIYGGGDDI